MKDTSPYQNNFGSSDLLERGKGSISRSSIHLPVEAQTSDTMTRKQGFNQIQHGSPWTIFVTDNPVIERKDAYIASNR
jgi:hypothetical protein